jgi:[ribosomal protein S18]-alanine N-acetyltransferase
MVSHARKSAPFERLEVRGRTYTVRPLDYRHVDELHDMDVLCFPPGRAFTTGYFILLFFYDNAFGWGLEEDGKLTAFILVTLKRHNANIATIDVHPHHRRRGLGEALMKLAETKLRDRGVRSISLQVGTENEGAQELYNRQGFTRVRTLKNYYIDGDAYLMRKRLDNN